MKVSAQYATEHIADLFLVASSGEDVEIVAPDKPSLKLVLVPAPSVVGANTGFGEADLPRADSDPSMWKQPQRPRSELFGSLAGQITLAEDWDSAETNKQIQEMFEGSDVSAKMGRG